MNTSLIVVGGLLQHAIAVNFKSERQHWGGGAGGLYSTSTGLRASADPISYRGGPQTFLRIRAEGGGDQRGGEAASKAHGRKIRLPFSPVSLIGIGSTEHQKKKIHRASGLGFSIWTRRGRKGVRELSCSRKPISQSTFTRPCKVQQPWGKKHFHL